MQNNLDHIVIGAKTLADGMSYVQSTLGVNIPFGGVHLQMGTHNCLMQLGKSLFLEIIAINPDIPPPAHPRWYGLDDPFVRQQLRKSPMLLTWVINTRKIDMLLSCSNFHMGNKQPVSRGELKWYFSLPEDGRLLAGGLLPYAIEWQAVTHPAVKMSDLGCRLESLELHHPQPLWLKESLDSICVSELVKIVPIADTVAPFLVATIDTPSGKKIISSSLCE